MIKIKNAINIIIRLKKFTPYIPKYFTPLTHLLNSFSHIFNALNFSLIRIQKFKFLNNAKNNNSNTNHNQEYQMIIERIEMISIHRPS